MSSPFIFSLQALSNHYLDVGIFNNEAVAAIHIIKQIKLKIANGPASKIFFIL
jgi:hypothetical protein